MILFAETAFSSGLVTLEVLEVHIALVTLNRPLARNPINAEMANAIEAIVSRTEADHNVWVVVLTGTGPDVFCAGADLKEVAAGRATSLFTSNGFAGFVDADR
ncbi:enoyl-CoA hydratase, partial [Pseudomonas sp. MWU13-2860]